MTDTPERITDPPPRYAKLNGSGVVEQFGTAQLRDGDTAPFLADMGAELISEDLYQQIARGRPWKKTNGVYAVIPDAPTSLATAKARAIVKVDQGAERARLAWITPGAGQALEYSATEREARDAFELANPLAVNYPWLAAEQMALATVGITVSIRDVAAQVIAQADAWAQVGAAIKAIRRGAKLQIDAAATVFEVEAAAASVIWPSPS